MNDKGKQKNLGSMLIAEIGSVTTRVLLVDTVEGETRLISQVEKPSTTEPPHKDATIAIFEACALMEEMTGRTLLKDGHILMPQNNERDGINNIIATSSAAGNLSFVITAIASDISARSGIHACRSTYTSILQIITLDDFEKTRDERFVETPRDVFIGEKKSKKTSKKAKKRSKQPDSGVLNNKLSSTSWMERQVESMLALDPDVVLITGGIEGSMTDTLKRLAHMVALTTLKPTVDEIGQHQQETTNHPIIYAGNSAAQKYIRTLLEGRADVIVLDNLRPSLDQENLEPAYQEINRLYTEYVLPRLPGFESLQRLCHEHITTVCQDQALITRFMAERYGRQVLTLDIGSSTSSAFLARKGYFNLSVLGSCGSGFGITTIIKERDILSIARWLPFPINESELTHWMLNKLLRPHLIPATRKELLIEHAVARETLSFLLAALAEECPALHYDMVLACGGVLSQAAHPGLAALTLLDALQPTGEDSILAIDLHLDVLSLLAASGAMANFDAEAAVMLFDRDIMQNMPLATCVVALGEKRPGKVALLAELTPLRGAKQQVKVRHGEIVCLPLPQGTKAQLTLRPTGGVRIGRNAPGEEVTSDVAAINGSALGVIIDARGRPLHLPDNPKQRYAQLWKWLVAMGVERDKNPYLGIELGAEPEYEPDDVDDEIAEKPKPKPTPKTKQQQKPVRAPKKGQKKKPSPTAEPSAEPVADVVPAQPTLARTEAEPQHAPVVGETEVGAEGAAKPGGRISLSDHSLSDSPAESAPEPGSMEGDLASLRMTVEDPNEDTKGKKGKKAKKAPKEKRAGKKK